MQADILNYMDQRIKEFESKLNEIETCRLKEIAKPWRKRNVIMLYMLHRDATLYDFCINEFMTLKQKIS